MVVVQPEEEGLGLGLAEGRALVCGTRAPGVDEGGARGARGARGAADASRARGQVEGPLVALLVAGQRLEADRGLGAGVARGRGRRHHRRGRARGARRRRQATL
jgi:hypothetical protein